VRIVLMVDTLAVGSRRRLVSAGGWGRLFLGVLLRSAALLPVVQPLAHALPRPLFFCSLPRQQLMLMMNMVVIGRAWWISASEQLMLMIIRMDEMQTAPSHYQARSAPLLVAQAVILHLFAASQFPASHSSLWMLQPYPRRAQ